MSGAVGGGSDAVRVAFAALFRSYGSPLIADCGGGTHTVMAGFDRVNGQVEQPVPAGDPAEVMLG